MSFKLGNTNIGELYVGSNKIAQAYLSSNLVYKASAPVDPWNPLNLPAYTLRIKLTDTTYDCSRRGFKGTWTRVGTDGTWDIYYPNSNWSRLIRNSVGFWGRCKEFQLLGLNATGVTNMERFCDCSQNFMRGTIPLFDTTALTDVTNCFYECYFVDGGQLALYQQMSTQTNPPTLHSRCFNNCGIYTQTGAAELAQIPSDWK